MSVTLVSPQDLDHAKAALAEVYAEATRRASVAAAGGEIGEPIRVVLDGAAELLDNRDCRRAVEAISRVCRKVAIAITLRDAFASPRYGRSRPLLGNLGGLQPHRRRGRDGPHSGGLGSGWRVHAAAHGRLDGRRAPQTARERWFLMLGFKTLKRREAERQALDLVRGASR